MKRRSISQRLMVFGDISLAFLILMVLMLGRMVMAEQVGGKERVFVLDEVSVFHTGHDTFARGQSCPCSTEPHPQVKVYPAFKSDKPLYGSVWFAAEYGQPDSGILHHFAIDESETAGKGYDRLYFDLNHDLDLANDTPLLLSTKPPDGAMLNYSNIEQQVCFANLDLNPDTRFARELTMEIMPRLTILRTGYACLYFVTTKAWQGRIKIAGEKFNVLLGHDYSVSGWFDRPWTALYLTLEGDSSRRSGAPDINRLAEMSKIGQSYYRFSATSAGDKLTVRPYEGDFGTFEVSLGGHNITKIDAAGTLRSRDAAIVVGRGLSRGQPKPVRSCELPVGDYLPTHMSISLTTLSSGISDDYHSESLGTLSIWISDNYHSDGKPHDMDRPKGLWH